VIAVDTNILVYAHRQELPKHRAAARRIVELAQGRTPWALPVFCAAEFLRIITHPRLFHPPHTVREACEALARVLASPSMTLLTPGSEFPALLFTAMKEADAKGNLVFGAQIVALCREAGVRALLTEDRDFARFHFPTERLKE
jgi:toxin-antitoxin system PIN domain toxin